MRSTFLTLFLVLTLFSVFQFTNGHGQFINPRPRTFGRSDALTQKRAPCGSVAKRSPTQNYKAGQIIPVTWHIQANHGGFMKINIIDYSGGASATLIENIRSVGGNTTVNVTIPDRFCSNCTLQWLWAPANEAPYYGCVDINVDGKIVTQNSTGTNNNNNNNNGNTNNKNSAVRIHSSLIGCLFALLSMIVFQL